MLRDSKRKFFGFSLVVLLRHAPVTRTPVQRELIGDEFCFHRLAFPLANINAYIGGWQICLDCMLS